MYLSRPYAFVTLLLLSYFNPITLLWLGTSWTFIFVTATTLLIWIFVRWERLKNAESRGTLLEVLLGSALIVGNFARNFLGILGEGAFGLVDMFIVFIGVSLIFYGVKGLKMLSLPALYFVIMITAYRAEFALEEVRNLEYFMAGLMGSFVQLFGIEATVLDNTVMLVTPYGAYVLQIDGPCTGIKGMLAYGSLATLMLVDLEGSGKRKLMVASVGLVGTFMVNLARLAVIFLTIYFAGIETGLALHTYLGYGMFLGWVLLFWAIAMPYISKSSVRAITVVPALETPKLAS